MTHDVGSVISLIQTRCELFQILELWKSSIFISTSAYYLIIPLFRPQTLYRIRYGSFDGLKADGSQGNGYCQ